MPDPNPLAALYPQPPSAQPNALSNPLDALKMAYTAVALQKSRQELQAKQAASRAIQNTMNPDGSANFPAAQNQLLKDPTGGQLAASALPDILDLQKQTIANGTAQIMQQGQQMGVVGQYAGALATKKDLNGNDLDNLTTFAVGKGGPPAAWAAFRTALGTPANARGWLTQLHKMGIPAAALAAPQEVLGPRGTKQAITTGQFLEGTQAASGNVAALPGGAPGGGMQTELAPGQSESAVAQQSDLRRAANYQNVIYPWQQALKLGQDLQSQGQTLGPGSKYRQEIESSLYALSPTVARWAGVDPEKIEKYAEFEKYTTQGLQQQASRFGPQSDQRFATAAAGTPNVHITDLAGIPLIKATIGMTRLDTAQVLENSRFSGTDYTLNSAKWAARQDPSAYMVDMMPRQTGQKLQKKLKGAERTRFNASLQAAIRAGVIVRPQQQTLNPQNVDISNAVHVPDDHPILGGAKQSPQDGRHYVPDPNRPGKFLMVVP